jgi:hypothetical protein
MKKILTAILMIGISVTGFSQQRVTEEDIIGEWKLVIDIDREEIEEEIDDEDNWIARGFAKAVSGFALDIVEEIDIKMDFRKDGEVRIRVEVFGSRDTEYANWRINKDGELEIDDDWRRDDDDDDNWGRSHSKFSSDADVWMMDGKKLVAYDKGYRGKLKAQDVYMVKR